MSAKARKSVSRLNRAVRATIEKLEHRRLLSADPLAYQNVVQTLPYVLNFTSAEPGVFDQTGTQGTGFTLVQPNKNGTQYQPSLISLNTAAGELDLTTQGTATTGSNNGTDNTLVNGLETRFDATTAGFTVTTRLKGPLSQINTSYDGGGVFFGPDEDNYVKFVAEYDSAQGGQILQFYDEQNATTHTINTYQSIGSFANVQTLDLRLTGNAGTGTVTASYSVNGAAFVTVAGTVTLTGAEASAFFTASATAGIMGSSKGATPIVIPFSHFEIDAGSSIANRPSVLFTSPASGATGISVSAPIEADLNLPNAAINAQTITSSTVYLYQSSDQSPVPAVVNTSGGGDSIILTPSSTLAPNTQYTFVVTSGVQDTTGVGMVPYTMSFTTGAAPAQVDPSIQFTQTTLATATGAAFTCVKIGPDGDLYASTEDGRIFRWAINSNGTLGTPQIITSLQQFNGGKRLITGFAFDPSATAANPIMWVSNSYYALSGATTGVDFTGAITVMSGPNLATVQNAVTELPRSIADHSTEQPTFGPGPIAGHNYLYFAQASNTAYGAPDSTWGFRTEHLLTAAILRLDTTALNVAAGPLNVLTPDVGGTYNPYAVGAPLIIYATGVRNAFSLIFTSDGHLYAPNNGSSAGGNTPSYSASNSSQINGNRIDTGAPYSGANVPGLTDVSQTEDDYLYNIVQGGYYGHPNAYRGEYVLDDGNPSTGGVADEVFSAYPLGTNPDPNYRGAAWDFGTHISPDGIIEYQDKTFGGALQGDLLVTEYSAGSDIVALSRDSNGNITNETKGIAGFSNLNNPVSLVENDATGGIYVSELGGQKIVLLSPVVPAGHATPNKTVQPFNGIAKGYTGAATSAAQPIIITNTGTTALTFPSSGAFTIVNDPTAPTADASCFAITNAASLPTSLAPGASLTINVNYTATKLGLQYARLQVTSNDPNGTLYIALRGIGTPGQFGVLEPSLVQVLRAYNIPTIVGAGPNDVNINTQAYPESPDPSSQEVPMQRLVEATPGPITITPLATFSSATQPVSEIGYYTPGDPTDTTQLFEINKADAQTVNPTAQGATSFNPGTSPFSLYAVFPGTSTPNGSLDIHYSEDALNTQDPAHPRKFRFFPLETAAGVVVPNSYIVAAEDYNGTTYNSFINFVGIISNVMPAPNATQGSTPSSPTGNNPPVMGVQENQTAPGSTTLIFNTIQKPNPIAADVVHNTNTVTIHNTGDQPLVLSSLTLSDSTNWTLVNPPAAGTSIAPGGSLTVTIKFIASSSPPHTTDETNDIASQTVSTVQAAGGVWTGTLTISSNDPINPTQKVNLAGYWQVESEHENEPNLGTIANLLLGYTTNATGSVATQGTEFPNNGNTVVTYGSEVDPSTDQGLLVAADPSQPVSLLEVASFHQQINPVRATMGAETFVVSAATESGTTVTITTTGATGFQAGQQVVISGVSVAGYNGTFTITSVSGTTFTYTAAAGLAASVVQPTSPQSGWYPSGGSSHLLFRDQPENGQSVLPLLNNDSYSTVQTSFSPTGAFGLNLDGEKSQDSLNAAVDTPFNTSGHAVRFFPVIDSNGNTVPNTWIIGMDYRGYAGPNSDYQDLVMILSNATFEAMPATPIDLQATAGAPGVTLQWTPVNGAVGYNVYRSTSAGGTFTLLNSAPITAAAFLDSQAPSGATSYYKITAVNSGGVESLPATTSVAAIPAAPTTLTATAQNASSIKLTWTASIGATVYHIEREVLGSNTFVEIGTTGATSYVDAGLLGSTSYVYQIRAANGSGYSPYSNVATATTQSGVAPGAPTNLHSSLNGSNQVVLTWTAASGTVTAYHVERELLGDTTFTEIAANVTTTTFTDLNATPGLTYVYRVRAENAGTLGAYSSTVTQATGTAPPTGLTASAISTTEIDLNWIAAAGTVTLYHIERQDPVSLVWSEIGTTAGLAYKDQTAQIGTTYSYRVRSENSGSFSAYTATVQASTPGSAPAAPATVTATANSSTQVTVSWSAVSGATSYIVQREAAGATSFTTLSGAYTGGTTLVDNTASANTSYTYQVAAQNAAGAGGFTQAQVTTVAGTYSSADIASVPAGSTVVNTDGVSYDITAGGTDIGSTTTDGFRFVYQQLTGNFDASVQVQSLTNTFSTAKAGLMVRSTLDAGSAMVFDGATAASSFRWLYRTALNATPSFNSVGSTVAFPNAWVRLTRIGNVFTGYYSTDGVHWSTGGSVTLALPQTLYFGMAVTSHNTSATTTAQLRSLNVLTPPVATTATAVSNSSSTVSVNWTSVPAAASYTILRFNSATSSYASIATGVTGTTFLDTALAASTLYQYEVVAVNSVGSSPVSNMASATTQAAQTVNNAPPAPTGLAGTSPSPTEIDITWNASTGATSYSVLRSVSGGTFTTIVPSTTQTSYQDITVASGMAYQYEVIATNSSGSSPATTPVTVNSQVVLATADIGTTTASSTNVITNESAYDVTAGGTAIYNAADSFSFIYTPITGNFDIAVQVTNLTPGVSGTTPQAGLMARATLDPASPEVSITAGTTGGYRLKHRDTSGGATAFVETASSISAAFPNAWVRLQRVGNVFTTYYGTDGSTWTKLGSVTETTLPANTPIYVGLAVASNSATATTTASFRNLIGI